MGSGLNWLRPWPSIFFVDVALLLREGANSPGCSRGSPIRMDLFLAIRAGWLLLSRGCQIRVFVAMVQAAAELRCTGFS